MDEVGIMILPQHTDRAEAEEYYQGSWQSIRRYRDLEIVISTTSVTDSEVARKVFIEIIEEICRDVRKNIRLVRKLLGLGEDNGFSSGTCISITKTSSGYVRYYDHWGGLAQARLGDTLREAILARIKLHEIAKRAVKRHEQAP